MELFDLTGRTAIITGGNGGLGLAMARGIAKAGANVAIWARNAAKNAAARDELKALGQGEVIALTCDVGDEASIEAAMAATIEALGRADICFANAGISGAGTAIPDITAEGWDQTMAINARGAALVHQPGNARLHRRGRDPLAIHDGCRAELGSGATGEEQGREDHGDRGDQLLGRAHL